MTWMKGMKNELKIIIGVVLPIAIISYTWQFGWKAILLGMVLYVGIRLWLVKDQFLAAIRYAETVFFGAPLDAEWWGESKPKMRKFKWRRSDRPKKKKKEKKK